MKRNHATSKQPNLLQLINKIINIFFNWDSLPVKLNIHYKVWSYKNKKHKKIKHKGNLFRDSCRKNLETKGVY